MTTQYFSAHTTQTHPAIAGGTTAPPAFSRPTATQPPAAPARARIVAPPRADLTDWLRSTDARRYEGRWVLLDDNLAVLDSDTSPTSLLQRNSERGTPLVVFVDPAHSQLAV
jgi:hypothetical protein